jgi:hypothetical protein
MVVYEIRATGCDCDCGRNSRNPDYFGRNTVRLQNYAPKHRAHHGANDSTINKLISGHAFQQYILLPIQLPDIDTNALFSSKNRPRGV